MQVARQSNAKMSILAIAKKIDQQIVELLTNQEKEEYYEVHLHISTFTLEDTPAEEVKTLQIVIVPQTQQTIVSAQQQEEEGEQSDEETQSNKREGKAHTHSSRGIK